MLGYIVVIPRLLAHSFISILTLQTLSLCLPSLDGSLYPSPLVGVCASRVAPNLHLGAFMGEAYNNFSLD